MKDVSSLKVLNIEEAHLMKIEEDVLIEFMMQKIYLSTNEGEDVVTVSNLQERLNIFLQVEKILIPDDKNEIRFATVIQSVKVPIRLQIIDISHEYKIENLAP